ncbi:putative carboxylesterase [Amylocarpus encephaloides]|uniref:Carboxylic ester hydrolase n=1 Tax=Amylocarpus encephaloides TaxID=45428 RepID=A0A9P7YFG3_9HELO|nr:putative carboxylesterase [Amylocarpus encephaloides]
MKAAYLLSLLGASTSYGISVGQTVQTTSGPVKGHAATVKNTVSSYFGIPYAIPPVGALRFMPPIRYYGGSTLEGSKIGHACPAVPPFGNDLSKYNIPLANMTAQGVAFVSDIEQVEATFNEDCLHLNVWVPTGGEEKKAVMIWIYGGSYKSGSTQIGLYDGQHLAAEQDVIVVTLNYRVDILGFHGDPASKNQNPGFLDQRMAVEWVRDNIASFGGDPSRMILFGQSAGSASVDSYTYSWPSDPIVSGFIMESGAAGFGEELPANNAVGWYDVAATLGCGTNTMASNSEILSCLQGQDIDALMAAMGSNSFNPSVDNITGFADYTALSKAGKFAQLPILTGNNDFEAGIYIPVLALYSQTHYDPTYWQSLNNKTFACPAGVRANVSASHGLPTWRYRWFGNFPNTRLLTDPDSGAYHCGEIPFVFNTLPTGAGIPEDTEEEISIRKYVQGAWAAFAKDPKGGLSTYGGGWPQYSPFKETLIRLAYDNVTGTNVVMPEVYDATCLTTYPIGQQGGQKESCVESHLPGLSCVVS